MFINHNAILSLRILRQKLSGWKFPSNSRSGHSNVCKATDFFSYIFLNPSHHFLTKYMHSLRDNYPERLFCNLGSSRWENFQNHAHFHILNTLRPERHRFHPTTSTNTWIAKYLIKFSIIHKLWKELIKGNNGN